MSSRLFLKGKPVFPRVIQEACDGDLFLFAPVSPEVTQRACDGDLFAIEESREKSRGEQGTTLRGTLTIGKLKAYRAGLPRVWV